MYAFLESAHCNTRSNEEGEKDEGIEGIRQQSLSVVTGLS